jgi:hypothetical protein
MVRRLRLALFMSLVCGLALPSLAWARTGPPNPIEAGEFYITGSYGRQAFGAPKFRNGLQYVDDTVLHPSYFSLEGDTQGYLINLETKAYDYVPEVAIGWGFGDTAFEGLFHGVLRAEVSVHGQRWSTRNVTSGPLLPPTDGYTLPDPDDELNEFDTGLLVVWSAIDGSQNTVTSIDGDTFIKDVGLVTDGYLYGFPWGSGTPTSYSTWAVFDAGIEIKEESGTADFMFYLDNSNKKWQMTRGVGFSYARLQSNIHHFFRMPGVFDFDTIDGNPTLTDDSFDYNYKITTNYFGAKLAFSTGYEFIKGLTAYVSGSFTPYIGFADLDGNSNAPCLGDCMPYEGVLERGTVYVNRTKTLFAYDAQAGIGVSYRFWKFRITGEGGGEQFWGYVRPQSTTAGEKVDMKRGGSWGWYWSASAGIAF